MPTQFAYSCVALLLGQRLHARRRQTVRCSRHHRRSQPRPLAASSPPRTRGCCVASVVLRRPTAGLPPRPACCRPCHGVTLELPSWVPMRRTEAQPAGQLPARLMRHDVPSCTGPDRRLKSRVQAACPRPWPCEKWAASGLQHDADPGTSPAVQLSSRDDPHSRLPPQQPTRSSQHGPSTRTAVQVSLNRRLALCNAARSAIAGDAVRDCTTYQNAARSDTLEAIGDRGEANYKNEPVGLRHVLLLYVWGQTGAADASRGR